MKKRDAKWILTDVLNSRRDELKNLKIYKWIIATVAQQLAAFEAEAPAPLPSAIGPIHTDHINATRVLRKMLDALGDPAVATEAQVAAAQRLREATVEAVNEYGTSAVDRAQLTESLLPRRAALEADAAVFEGTKVPELLGEWFAVGEQLAAAVTPDAPPIAEDDEEAVNGNDLRRTLAMIRDAIKVELHFRPELPRDLEQRILPRLDKIAEVRRRPDPETAPSPEVSPVANPQPLHLPNAAEA